VSRVQECSGWAPRPLATSSSKLRLTSATEQGGSTPRQQKPACAHRTEVSGCPEAAVGPSVFAFRVPSAARAPSQSLGFTQSLVIYIGAAPTAHCTQYLPLTPFITWQLQKLSSCKKKNMTMNKCALSNQWRRRLSSTQI
jgi:hypothetical protein